MLEDVLAYIGIGSNLGDPLHNCREAIGQMAAVSGIAIERVSSFYKTEPVILQAGGNAPADESENQNWFVNAVAEIRTTLSARHLLNVLQETETLLGRVRKYKGAPRTVDLDLLLYGQEIIHETDLIVPHPEMHKRLFVLEPLCEIVSYVIHPAFGVSMRGLKARLIESKKVERIEI